MFGGSGGARSDAANVSRRSIARPLTRTYHLREQVDVVIALARHLFANRMKLFKESRLSIHICDTSSAMLIRNRYSATRHALRITAQNSALIKNSGVTIIGTKKPAIVLNNCTRDCRCTFAI